MDTPKGFSLVIMCLIDSLLGLGSIMKTLIIVQTRDYEVQDR